MASKFDVVNSTITWGNYILVGDSAIISVESTSETPSPNAVETYFVRTADGRLSSYDTANANFDYSITYYPAVKPTGRETLEDLYNSKYNAPLTITNKAGDVVVKYNYCELKNDSFLADSGMSKDSTLLSTINFQVGNDDDSRE